MFALFRYVLPCLLLIGTALGPEPSRANPALVLAPEVAIGGLELALLAVAVAAEEGILSQRQKQDYDDKINFDIHQLEDLMAKGFEVSKQIMAEALTTLISVQALTNSQGLCHLISRSVKANSGSSKKTLQARATSEGECQPELRGDPRKCCPDFMKKISKVANMEQVGENAFRLSYWLPHAINARCCFEWDSLHGRFEVYTKSNHSDFKHRGEKSCAKNEDLENDPCTANFPEKADLMSRRHAPRNGCP